MTSIRQRAAAALLAAGLAATIAPAVRAAETSDDPPAAQRDHGAGREHAIEGGHFPGSPPDGVEGRSPGGFGPGPGPHLRGMHLTQEQDDKLFALFHAQAPQRREQDKAIRKAHETLRELEHADKFDEARAGAAARELGQAVSAQALAHARLQAQVLAVLTPEQRERLHREHGMRRPGGGPEGNDPR